MLHDLTQTLFLCLCIGGRVLVCDFCGGLHHSCWPCNGRFGKGIFSQIIDQVKVNFSESFL